MFNTVAFKDFIQVLGDSSVENPDHHKKILFLKNMLDDETVLNSLREEWKSRSSELLSLVDDMESLVPLRTLKKNHTPLLQHFKIAGFILDHYLTNFTAEDRRVFALHIRCIFCHNAKPLAKPESYLDTRDSTDNGNDNGLNLSDALSELQSSGAMQKVLSGAEKMAEDLRNGKKLDINSMLGDLMTAVPASTRK